MIRDKKRQFIFVAALLLPTLSASAEPRVNNMPATVCRPSGQGTPVYQIEGIGNTNTTQTLNLACPLSLSVRDNASFRTELAYLAAGGGVGCPSTGSSFNPAVTFFDRSSTQDVSCTLYVLGAGNAIVSSFTVSSSGSSTAAQRKTWSVPKTDLTGKHLYADCVVPPSDPVGGASFIEGFSIFTCDP